MTAPDRSRRNLMAKPERKQLKNKPREKHIRPKPHTFFMASPLLALHFLLYRICAGIKNVPVLPDVVSFLLLIFTAVHFC